jgi:putative transcriptional regulator
MTRKIDHHLDAATLMAFSAGGLGEALSAVAAAHLEMCEQCREELANLDLIGGVLLDAMPANSAVTAMGRALPAMPGDVVPLASRDGRARVKGQAMDRVEPRSFAARFGVDLAQVPWRRLGPGVWHYKVKLSPGVKGDLRLLKIAAGKRMPEHGHGGSELTLVLEGAYRDQSGEYRCGDIQDVDGDDEHQPVADSQAGCVCIIASEQRVRYKGLVNRLMQPLIGI